MINHGADLFSPPAVWRRLGPHLVLPFGGRWAFQDCVTHTAWMLICAPEMTLSFTGLNMAQVPANPLLKVFPSLPSCKLSSVPQNLYNVYLIISLSFKKKIIYFVLFLAALSLRCCVRFSLVVVSRGPSSLG